MNSGLFAQLKNAALFAAFVVLQVASSFTAEASHTRGSTLYWEKHPSLNNAIIVYGTAATAGGGTLNSYISYGTLTFGSSGTMSYYSGSGQSNTSVNFSANSGVNPVSRVFFVNSIENYAARELVRIENGVVVQGAIVQFASNQTWPVSLRFTLSCCRVSNISETTTGTESNLATTINLTAGNSSAASSSPAVIQVPLSSVGGTWTYQLSATDPDQDNITYRIGTNSEFGGSWKTSVAGPIGLSISSTGLITYNVPSTGIFNGTLAALGYVIEDRDPFNNTIKSQSSYDIILRFVDVTSNQPPVIVSQPNTTQYFPYQQSLSVPYNFTIVVEDVYNGTTNMVPDPSASAPAGYLNWPYPQISQIGSIPNLSYTVNYLPNTQRAEINGTFTPSLAQAGGTYSAQFQVNDGSLIVYPSVFIQVRNNPNPSVAAFTKVGDICQGVSFAAADFTSNYTDPDQDPLEWIRITNVPSGSLLFKGQAVTNATEILLSEIGQLTYTNGTPGTYSFSWEGQDNQGYWSTSAEPVQITIAGIATSTGSVVNNGTSSSFAVDPNLVVVATSNITSATVSISSGFVAGDLLSVPTHTGGTATYDSQLGVLTFTGNYTSSELQSALRLVEFQSQGTSQQRTFAFSAGAQIVGACNAFLGYKSLNNTLPTISSIANQTTCIGGTTPQASITVADTETGVNDLIVSVVSSSNLSVVPLTNITLAGTGANRSVTVSNSGVFGSSVITLAVTDQGGGQTTTSFVWSNTSTDGIVASAGSTFNPYAGTPVVVDPYITVTSQSNVSGALVSISNFQSGDVLAMQSGYSLPSGLTAQFNSSTGVLTLTGSVTAANMQAALRKVEFSTTSTSELARSITFSLGSALPNPANGHFYEYVSGTITWANALSAAESLTFNGLQGYLATVLSSDENEFIRTKLSNDGWIGATDDYAVLNSRVTSANYADQSAAEGQWHWVAGPASDRIQFWNGLINGQTVNSAYVNWNSNQPDNHLSGEHYMQIYFLNNGTWNDLPGGSYTLPGYIVEYGGIGTSQSCFAISTTKVLELNQTPTFTVATAQSSCIGATSITRNLTVADANDGTGALQLSLLSSSNTGLVPLGNVSFSGSGASRVVTIVPVANVTGTSNLVIQITDRYGKSSQQTLPITVSASSTLSIQNSLCGGQSLLWASWNNVTGTSGQGTFGNLGVTVSLTHSAGGMTTTSTMFNHSVFPSQYTVPNTTSLRNDLAGTFTFCFSQPVTNPQIAFSSIGNPSTPVGVISSVPYQIIWSGQNVVYNSATQFTGSEGFNIVSFPGTHQCITLQYTQNEAYVNLAFGFENFNCTAPTICSGQSVTLTASGGSSYEWSPSTGLSATNTASVVATPTATTTYTVIDPTNPCVTPQTITVTVPVPTAPVANPVQQFCRNNTLEDLVATAPQGQTVTWHAAATGGAALPITTPLVSGTTYYAQSNDATCGVSPTRTAVLAELTPSKAQTSSGPVGMVRGTPQIIDPQIAVDQQQGNIDGALVFVSTGFVSGDLLDFPGTLPSGITKSYNASTGVLTFTGYFTPAQLESVFRGVTINTTSMNGQDRTVTFNAGSALPFGGNNHFYRFVTASGISWTNARNAAAQLTYNGLQGYLATITSLAENQFVASRLAGQGWMGASDAAVEGVWKWETGPETGVQFWQGLSTGSVTGGLYNNWASGEPNNAGDEDYAHFLTNGQWNDYPLQLSNISGYVVEFGGMPSEPCVILSSDKLVNVTISTPPTVTTSTSFTQTSTGISVSGDVTSDGNAAVTDRGFVFATSSSPTTSNTKLSSGTGTGVFNATVTGLQPATQFYLRAFATNSVATSYGNEISFFTRPADISGVTSSDFNTTHQANVICYGASTTLTAAGVSGVVYWYTGSCGGTQVGTGNTLTVSPTTTTTYYARNYNNNLFSDGCASITVVVRPQLVAPTISGAEIICWNSQSTGLTGVQASGGSSTAGSSGFSYQWQKSEDFGTTWTDLIGETNPVSLLPGYLYQTTQYRLQATDLGSPSCTTDVASNVIEVTVRDPFTPSVVSTTNPNNTVCQSGSVSLTATQTTGGSGPPFQYQWQRSYDSINWVDEGPALQNTTAYTVPSVTTDTYYRLIAFDMGTPGCGSVFSTNAVLATVQTAITEGSISGAQHICAGTAPTTAITSVTVGTGRGTISYRWEASTDNGQTWTTISGATAASYQPGVLQTTTDYRRFTVSTVNNVNCESLQPTSVVRITVDQLPVATIAASGTTSCVNTAVAVPGVTINHGTAVWTHNGQGAITGTLSAPIYTPVAADAGTTVTLTLTVTGTAICLNVPAVDTYVIVVDPLPVATAGGSATICENRAHTVSGAAAANGTILWTHNGTGSLANAATLTPTYTAAAGDAGQAVVLTMTVSSNNTCTPTTATATYTVNVDQLPAASAGGTQTICSLASATVSGAASARGSILWTHNGSGSLSNATTLTPTYTASAADAGTTVTLTMTVTSTNVCGPQTATATYTVVVRPDFVPATFVNQKQDLCYNSGASQITATAATGGTGPYAYQWQVSTDSTTWTSINGATSLTYTPSGTFTSSRFYRILSTDLGLPACGTTLAGAADVKLLVRAPLTPPVLANVTICQGASTTLTPSLALGGRNNFTYQWQQSANGTTGWTNVGTASASIAFTTPNLSGTTFYRVIARDENVTLNNLTYISCGSTFSQPIRVTVAATTLAGSISGDETTCVGAATAAIASATAGTGSGTLSYRWEQSTDNGTTWTTVAGANAASYAPGALSQTTLFRRYTVATLNGSSCESAPTASVTKTVEQLAVFTAAGSNVTTNTDPGLPTAVVNYTVTATAVTPVTVTYAFTGATTANGNGTGSGSAFGIGTTTVTVTAATQCGATTSTFTVEVSDNENPVITAGADITVSNVPSPTQYTYTSGSLSSSIFSNSNMTYTYNFNDPLPVGAVVTGIEVTFTNTVSIPSGFYAAKTIDLNGTTLGSAVSSGGSFTDVVTYNGPMSVYNYGGANAMRFDAWWNPYVLTGFTMKLNYTMPFEGCERTISVASPTATDNAPGLVVTYATTGVTQVSGTAPLTETFAVGTTTITWTATDASGNTATDVQLVTVTDDADPVIAGTPANITVNASAGLCTAAATWTVPTATDDCGIQTYTGTYASGDLFPVGATTVTYTATDIHGNVATSSFTVTVVDNQLPLISGTPSNITVTSDANACGTSVTWTAATSADNCGISTFAPNIAPGSFFAVGRTRVRYTALDVNGNSDTTGFWVEVLDRAPVLSNMPTNITVSNDAGLCSAVVTWNAPSFTDNCSGTVLTSTHTPGQAFAVGTTTVTYTATDNNGNATSASFTVTVNDTELPVWSNVPANITVAARATSCDAVVTWSALTLADNCTAQPTVTSTKASGDVFALGTTTVTYTGVDAAGNTATSSFTVTVVDQTAPVITVPANITESVDANACTSSAVSIAVPAASDQCDVVGATGVRSDNLALTAPFPLGVTTITWTASDLAGNAATPVVQSVTVVDTIAPYVSTQLDSIVYVDENSCVYYWEDWRSDLVIADNCGETAVLTSARPQNLFLSKGVHVINFTISDSHGNARVYNQRVRVADTISPKLTNMPANITAYANANCEVAVTWTDPTPSDNCVNFVMTSSHDAGDIFSIGVTPVTFLVTDASGRTVSGGFTITVVDTVKPVIPTQAATLVLNAQGAATLSMAQVVTAAGITDNCGVASSSLSKTAFGCTDLGANTVSITATDVHGNTRTRNVTVTVVDNTAPTVVTKAATLYLNASGTATLAATAVNNGTTDNCGVASYSLSKSTFNCSNVGANAVTLSATDASGNVGTATATVTVLDTIKPVLTIANTSITAYVTGNQCSRVVVIPGVSATDNCAATVTMSPASGSVFSVGTTPVVTTATDASGNTVVRSINVIVLDTISPVIAGVPVSANITPVAGSCAAVVTWATPAAFDNCTVTLTSSATSGSTFAVGTHTVTWTAVDPSGNSTSASLTFTVTDAAPPVISNVPSTITRYSTATQCSAVASWSGITAVDNCGTATVTTSVASGSVFNLGSTTVTVTATDAAGNQSTSTFQVVVLDTINPIWNSVPQNITIGSCASAVTYSTPGAVDNCGAVTVTQTSGLPSGSVFPVGVTTNTFVATDASGNTTTTSFTVTVQGSTFSYTPAQTVFCFNDAATDLMPVGGNVNLSFSGAGVSGSIFTPRNAGVGNHVITYTYVDSLGCQTVNTFTLTVNASPSKPVIMRMTSTTLKVVDTYQSYQWRRNGVNIAGATQQTFTVTTSGIYDVVVSNGLCSSVSDPYGFGVTIGEDELELNDLRVQPNPNNGEFTLIHSLPLDEVQSVQIVDMLGRVVFEAPLHDVRMSFDVRSIAQGQYLVVVRSSSNVITKPIVIQH